ATLRSLRKKTGPSPAPLTPNAGQSISSQRTAAPGNEVTEASILNADRCQNPLAVGASGSKQVRVKLWVPAGTFDQDSCGSSSRPPTPRLSITERVGSGPLSVKSWLVTVISCKVGNGAYGSYLITATLYAMDIATRHIRPRLTPTVHQTS